MPGARVRVAVSPATSARRSWSGSSTASSASAIFGPTPDTDWTSSNSSLASSEANPNRVSESSRTTRLVDNRACSPRRKPGQGRRGGPDGQTHPADLDDGVVQMTDSTWPRTELIMAGPPLARFVCPTCADRAATASRPCIGERHR